MTYLQKIIGPVSLIAVLIVLSGCSTKLVASADLSDETDTGKRVVAVSEQMLGTPYRYGGESPQGFDCSGLVRYAYRQVGIEVPRSSRLIYKQSTKVPINKLQPGDLLFFKINHRSISHVGIYTKDQNFIHAPSSGKNVRTARLDSDYWATRLAGAGRIRQHDKQY